MLGLLKAKQASVPNQTSSTELIYCNYIFEVILLHVHVDVPCVYSYDQ